MNTPIVYYLTADYPPDINAGSVRASETVAALAEQAHVIVLTNRNAKANGKEKVKSLGFDNPQGQVNYAKRLLREFIFVFIAFFRLLVVPSGSIIVIATPPFLGCLLFGLLPRRRKVRRVLDVRDLYPDVFVYSKLIREDSLVCKAMRAFEVRAYRRSDLVLTVSPTLKNVICRRSGHDAVQVVMNGYPDYFADSEHKVITCARPFKIVAHGNFGQFQDVDLINKLILATTHLDIEYTFVGFGGKLSQITKTPKVNILDSLNREEILKLLKKQHLGLSFRTSDYIGRNAIPVKVLEYLGLGIPAIIVPRMPDLVELEEVGAVKFFESDQVKDMISFLTTISSSLPLYQMMINGVLLSRDKYSRFNQVRNAKQYILDLSKDEGVI